MCYSIHKYDCGHASRKHRTECRNRGDVSHYFKKWILKENPYCNRVIEKRRRKLCSACASHEEENEELSRGRTRTRPGESRREHGHDHGRRHKDHERKDKGEHRDRHKKRKEKNGDRERRHREQEHRTREREEGRRAMDQTVDDYSNLEQPYGTIPIGIKTPLVPEQDPQHTGFNARDWPDGYGAPQTAKHSNLTAWVNGLGIEPPEDARPWTPGPKAPEPLPRIVGEPSNPQPRRSANVFQTREPSPEPPSPQTPTPRPLSLEPVSPLCPPSPAKPPPEEYIPVRAEWRDFPSAPSNTYQPEIITRPASSVYASSKIGGFPPTAYSCANESDFFTVYAETEVPSKKSQDIQRKKSQETQRSRPSGENSRGKSSKSFDRVRAKWPEPAIDENSRYANLAGTSSEYMAQQNTRAQRERLSKVKVDGENAELREEQEAWKRAVNAVKAEEAEKERRRQRDVDKTKRRQASRTDSSSNWSGGRTRVHKSSTRTGSTNDQVQNLDKSTYIANTDWSSNPYDEYPQKPSIDRSQSSSYKTVEKVWNPMLQTWVPAPTQSSIGANQFQHPRTAPRPPLLDRRHSDDAETTVSLFHPRQPHTANPKTVEQAWGKTSGRSCGKKSKTESAKSTPKNSSRPSFASFGRISSFRKKFSRRQSESEVSFRCADAARHDFMHTPRPGSSNETLRPGSSKRQP